MAENFSQLWSRYVVQDWLTISRIVAWQKYHKYDKVADDVIGSYLYPLICSADGVTRKEYSASKRESVKPSPESVVNRIPKEKNGSAFRASY